MLSNCGKGVQGVLTLARGNFKRAAAIFKKHLTNTPQCDIIIMSRGGSAMKHEIFYKIGNQKAIGYFTDSEIDYLQKNTSIEIISIKRGN